MDSTTLIASLERLAESHTWAWDWNLRELLDGLPGGGSAHPASVVASLSSAQLADLGADDDFKKRLGVHISRIDELMAGAADAPSVAYFSPEFGISELVPQYSGGLGILAGDHLKASSDLGLSLVGVGLLYRNGFFRQSLVDGQQAERRETYDPIDIGATDTGLIVDVPIAARTVQARVWKMAVGRIPVVLLDTDVVTNSTADRAITDSLYSGDRLHRIEQELVLGVGGARALAALGWAPDVFHLNEGHAGFLILELLDREISAGATLDEARERIRGGLVFTTHTPVPAGIDIFEAAIASAHLRPWADAWGLPLATLAALGADPLATDGGFNMAVLCLESAGQANGVSKLHGEVSRTLFAQMPSGAAIGSITNGVHARTWTAPHLQAAFDEACGPGWADGDPQAWEATAEFSDEEIRTLRRTGSATLAAMVTDRLGVTLDPDALTVGFARRFATYKRANLLLQNREGLAALLADDQRPLQIIFAGKAHPADVPGKALLAEIVAFSRSDISNGRFHFVPDYDMEIARAMYAGSDVWLNTPIRPHEASGTSGEKSALNGGLNCSISDGWWDEMADERNGWTIPDSPAKASAQRDAEESAAALALLADEIVPTYYADGGAWSTPWLGRVRHCWSSLGPKVTAARMVSDYRDQLYSNAIRAGRPLT